MELKDKGHTFQINRHSITMTCEICETQETHALTTEVMDAFDVPENKEAVAHMFTFIAEHEGCMDKRKRN